MGRITPKFLPMKQSYFVTYPNQKNKAIFVAEKKRLKPKRKKLGGRP